jgi:hypothetical protein
MHQDSECPRTTKRQRNHAPAALLRLGALAQRLTNIIQFLSLTYKSISDVRLVLVLMSLFLNPLPFGSMSFPQRAVTTPH